MALEVPVSKDLTDIDKFILLLPYPHKVTTRSFEISHPIQPIKVLGNTHSVPITVHTLSTTTLTVEWILSSREHTLNFRQGLLGCPMAYKYLVSDNTLLVPADNTVRIKGVFNLPDSETINKLYVERFEQHFYEELEEALND